MKNASADGFKFSKRKLMLSGIVICLGLVWLFWMRPASEPALSTSATKPAILVNRHSADVLDTSAAPAAQSPAQDEPQLDPVERVEASLVKLPRRVENGYTVLGWPKGKPYVRGEVPNSTWLSRGSW